MNPADFYFLHSHFYFISFFFFFIIFISSRTDFCLKIFEGNSENVYHKTNKNHSFSSRNTFCSSLRNVHQIFEYFVITLLKWMKYENRLVFAYYNILRFWRSSKFSKILRSFKTKKVKMSKYRNTPSYDFKSRFLVIFFSNYQHRLMLFYIWWFT